MEIRTDTTVGEMRKQAIIDTFFETLKNCRKIDPFATLEKIIEEPAPSFYLDTETFRCLLYKALRERNHEYSFCKI